MTVDFDAAVLGPCMQAFARPIVVTPIVSQPGQPAYPARGIWQRRNVDVAMLEGNMSSAVLTIGIRLNERNIDGTPMFVVSPGQGDQVTVPAHGQLPALGTFAVDDDDPDGEGGSMLTLKKFGAP